MTETTVAEVMAELAALEDPKTHEVNEKHGDDHGVNLSRLRALAKRLKTQQDLARQLWKTDDTAARLLALLICRPRAYERNELDAMLREARTPKVHDWLVNYVVKKNPHSEELRLAWSADPDPVVASAGWALTTERVARQPEGGLVTRRLVRSDSMRVRPTQTTSGRVGVRARRSAACGSAEASRQGGNHYRRRDEM